MKDGSQSRVWSRPICWGGAFVTLLWLAACAPSQPLSRYEFAQAQMGLPFRIVLYAPQAAQAERAAKAAFARIAQLNRLLSDYDSDSELSQLSQTSGSGREVPLSADLWFLLDRSQALAAKTSGAFDVTVGPYVNLWRKARREQKLPNPSRLEEARAAVGFTHLQLDARTRSARLVRPKMRLDLGGIAKGYAIDEALAVLRAHGIRRALVTGGGDMAASDPPPAQPGWRIQLAPLDAPNAGPGRFVRLSRAALATSGDLYQRLEIEGRRYSHIVDPHTGLGLTDHSLVTVIARDCTTADSLATAVSVLGPEQGLRLIRQTRRAEVRIMRQPESESGLAVYESAGFKAYYDSEIDRPVPRS